MSFNSNNGYSFANSTASAVWLSIASTGAATFSSTITSQSGNGTTYLSNTSATTGSISQYVGNDGANLRIGLEGNTGGVICAGSTLYDACLVYNGGHNFNISMGAATPALVITSGGNVLIGTTTATNQKLTVNSSTAAGQVRITGAAPTVYFTDTVTDPANYVGLVGLATQTNNFITGSAAGDFVMLNQASGYRLYVVNYSGGVYLTSGATSWTANSDIRLKNINSHIENAVEKLSTLQTINFSYKDDKFKKQNIGLIAQEVEKIFPELIDKNGDGMLGVRYTELVPVLIKAIQELKLEIETLKNK